MIFKGYGFLKMLLTRLIHVYFLLHKVRHSYSVAVLDGFVYDESSNFVFKIETNKLNKTSVLDFCMEKGGFLVMINSFNKQNILETYLSEINIPWQERYYFIDAENVNNQWKFHNGQNIQNTYFDSLVGFLPDQSKCAVLDSEVPMTPFRWTAMDCSIQESFICEYIPVCKAHLPRVPYAYTKTYTSNAIGAQSTYGCSKGLQPIGPNNTTCLVNLTWTTPQFVCGDPADISLVLHETSTSETVNIHTLSGHGSTESDQPITDGTLHASITSKSGGIQTSSVTATDGNTDLDTSTTNEDQQTTTTHGGNNISTQTASPYVSTTQSCRDTLQRNGYSCFCINKSSYNTTGLAERIQQLKDILFLDKTQTTKRKRRKYSARDDRISSISLGLVFGAGVLIISAGAIALSDAAVIYKAITNGPWLTGDKSFA